MWRAWGKCCFSSEVKSTCSFNLYETNGTHAKFSRSIKNAINFYGCICCHSKLHLFRRAILVILNLTEHVKSCSSVFFMHLLLSEFKKRKKEKKALRANFSLSVNWNIIVASPGATSVNICFRQCLMIVNFL